MNLQLRAYYRLMIAIVLTSLVLSCSENQIEEIPVSENEEKLIQQADQDTLVGPVIVPLEGDRDTLPKIQSKSANYSAVYNEIMQIRDIPVYIKVKRNTSGKRFLMTQGKGQELKWDYFDEGLDHQFYIKVLSSSTGIPALIYSEKEDMPISVGSYSSSPNDMILYTRSSASGSMFGASWDLLYGNSENSYVLESQDYITTGASYYDMYNNVITSSGNAIDFGKYYNNLTQEFEIIPVEDFKIKNVQFINDNTASLAQLPDRIISSVYVNDSPLEQSKTITVSEQLQESSEFNKTTKLSLNVSTSVNVKVPFFAEGQIDVSTTTGREWSYGESETSTKTISHSFPLRIPPYSRIECEIVLKSYEADIKYIATCEGLETGTEVDIEGRWIGTTINEDYVNVKTTNLNDPLMVREMKIPLNEFKQKREINVNYK
jgi:hypothetical protein|tara:strand:- start:872 stop:2167 length:1296 start_codon:yes stop_codon:yes gene_type:complete